MKVLISFKINFCLLLTYSYHFLNFVEVYSNETIKKKGEVIVSAPIGRIKGRTIRVDDAKVHFFNSIRFGAPPVGDRRFMKPLPADVWTDSIYDATFLRPTCFQEVIPSVPLVIQQDEDCLFLNVWSPSLSPQAKLPVLFWISGGGFIVGGANQIITLIYQSKYLASEGVVVVTINYRLGNLGFLYDGTEEAPGNVGLFDQVLAMKWVRKNIKWFGGDPNQVTIFGESSGGQAVGMHLISPLSKNLFQRAILQSGAAYSFGRNERNNSKALKHSKQLATVLGCFGYDRIKCLKKLPARIVMFTLADIIRVKPTYPESTMPDIVVNEFLPDGTVQGMKSGMFNKNKDILAGVNDGDGTIWAKILFGPVPEPVSPKFIRTRLAVLRDNYKDRKNWPSVGDMFEEYFGDLTLEQQFDNDLIKIRFADLMLDISFACPTLFQLTDYAKGSKGQTIRFYMLTHRPTIPFLFLCWKNWTRTCHADDLPMVFNYPISYPELYSEDDYQVSLMFKYFWTNFAKTGNPFSSEPPEMLDIEGFDEWPEVSWHEFRLGKPVQVMDLNAQRLRYFTDPWKRCDTFWRRYFYDQNKLQY